MKWVPTVLCVIIILGLVTSGVGTDPKLQTNSVSIFQRVAWSAQECARCPYGYQCYYNAWLPSLTLNGPVWVFGITNNASTGGILHFREYPDDPCRISCQDYIPVLYTAEVVYVPSYGGAYAPGRVPITYIPKGQYVVTSPSFPIQYNMRLWYFSDDGNGPELMDAVLKTDKEKYKREDTSVIFSVQVTDEETNQFIQVDSIFGEIILADSTRKTVEPEDWVWNKEEERHEYTWDFTNDDGVCADPKEGFYSTEMTVKKKYYKDVTVSTTFNVCYHAEITLEFNKNPPEYSIGEEVRMTVFITDENGSPVNTGVQSILKLPGGGEILNVLWTPVDAGVYVAFFTPEQSGVYSVTVEAAGHDICYLEEVSAAFFTGCERAVVTLHIGDTVVDEPTDFTLTVTDGGGNLLPGGDITGVLHFPDGSHVFLSWSYTHGVYTGEYTFSEPGFYWIRGAVTVTGGTCYMASFHKDFLVEDRRLPDLVIRNEDITVYPHPEVGDEVTIMVTVHNMGKADAGEFCVMVLIMDEESQRLFVESWTVYELAAGQRVIIQFIWKIEYSGKYTVWAIADAGNPEEIV
jgi:hypothetical protein